MCILALDVGDRRIGVAISDPTEMLAKPLMVIERGSREEDYARIAQLVREHEVEEVIIGYPENVRGQDYWRARRIEDFTLPLPRRLDVRVAFWEERFSTVSAQKAMREADHGERELVPAMLLQDFLDRRKLEGDQAET